MAMLSLGAFVAVGVIVVAMRMRVRFTGLRSVVMGVRVILVTMVVFAGMRMRVILVAVVVLTLRRCTREVVVQFLYPDALPVVPTFTLDGREHLREIRVDLPNLRGYALLGGLN